MFSNAKVGDKVWSFTYGWGEVEYIGDEDVVYPLTVNFDKGRSVHTFSGKLFQSQNQSLFWNEFETPESAYKKPLPKLEVDTKVLVWDDDDEDVKYRRYFKCFNEDGVIVCFADGTTSFSSESDKVWNNWELYEENKENEGK